MAKIVIVYESKAGHTLQYMKWLRDDLSADMFDVNKVSVESLLNYELIIYAGGVYSNTISGLNFIKKNMSVLRFKKIIVVAVGVMPVNQSMEKLLEDKNYNDEMKGRFPIFQLRSGFDKSKLNIADKLLLTAWKAKISKKEDRTNDDIMMLGMLDGMTDFTKKENIAPIVEFVEKGRWKLA